MKIEDKLDLEKVSSDDFCLNRLRGISHLSDVDNKNLLDSNFMFYIHDKKNDWKIVGNANVDFFYKDKKTMSHGILPGNSLVVGWIRIDDDHKGRKLGRKLLSYIEEKGKEKGMENVYATSVMADAKGFWKKMGYKWSGERRTWMKKL